MKKEGDKIKIETREGRASFVSSLISIGTIGSYWL